MNGTSRGWIAALVLAIIAIIGLGWYAYSESGGAPLALIAAAPFIILVRIAARRIRAGQH